MKKLVLTICLFLVTSPAWAAGPYYVRSDGGVGGAGGRCTGLTNAADPGSGTGQACAFNHPNWALETNGNTNGALAGSETLVIVNGSYRIGCLDADCRDGSYNLTTGNCAAGDPGACWSNPAPDGTSGTHTKIVGCTTSGCGCTANLSTRTISCTTTRPELWGAGRIEKGVINLENSDWVDVIDLEITDHDDGGNGHVNYGLGPSDPAELTAKNGVYMTGATNILLQGLKIHGMYVYGVQGGSISNVVFDSTNMDYNALGGYDGDTCFTAGTCGNTGTITFRNGFTANYNGCVEDNPGYGTIKAGGCYGGGQGGYGDAIGHGNTGGTWTFQDGEISYNTSDATDLRYINLGAYSGGSLVVKRMHMEGNAGNCVKGDGNSVVEDSVLIANCGFMYGKSTTLACYPNAACSGGQCCPEYCRASGHPIVFVLRSGSSATPRIVNNTVLSNGDGVFVTDGVCSTGLDVFASNNIFIGGTEFNDGSDLVSIYYDSAGTCDTDFIETDNLCYLMKEGTAACNGTNSQDATTVPSGLFTGTLSQGPAGSYRTTENYIAQLFLGGSSAAIGVSDETFSGSDSLDYNSFNRGAIWDAGAYEHDTTGGGSGCTSNGAACSVDGDCCSVSCEGSICVALTCGNSIIQGGEGCDDGDATSGDGCNSSCQVEGGYTCTGEPSVCTAGCGNGTINSGEECDDSNTTNGDGCSALCETEVAPYEKLLISYVETDPSSLLSIATHDINIAGLTRTSSTRFYKDFGASYFGNVTHDFEVVVDSCSGNAYQSYYALTNTIPTDLRTLEVANNDGIVLSFYCDSTTPLYQWEFNDRTGGGVESSTYNDTEPLIRRYGRIARTGSAWTAKLYSDANRTVQVGTTMSITDGTAYRYFIPLMSYNDGASGALLSGSIRDINLNLSTGTTCGANGCESGETCSSCPGDCGTCQACPNGACTGTETCSSCPADCGACGGTPNPAVNGCKGGARIRGGGKMQ